MPVDVFEELEGALVRVESDFPELLLVDWDLATRTSCKRIADQYSAVQTDIESIRYQKLIFRQNIHGIKCSLGHKETFCSWKFSLKVVQKKDTVHIQGCYNENQACHIESQQPDQQTQSKLRNRPLSLWNPVKVYSKSCSACAFLWSFT